MNWIVLLLASLTLNLRAEIVDKGGMPPYAWEVICGRILEDQYLSSILNDLQTRTNQNDILRVHTLASDELTNLKSFLQAKRVTLDRLSLVYWTRVEPTFKTVLLQYHDPALTSIVCILPLNGEWYRLRNVESRFLDLNPNLGIAQTFIHDGQKFIPLTSVVADVQNKGYVEKYKLQNSLPLVYIGVGQTNLVQVQYFIGNDRWISFNYLKDGEVGAPQILKRTGRTFNYNDLLKQSQDLEPHRN